MRYLFQLVHFPKGDYLGKLTQREIIFEEELSEHFKLSQRIPTNWQKTAKDDSSNAQPMGKSRVIEQLS